MRLQELTSLKEEIDHTLSIASDLMKPIAQKFREEWTYHSNAIEGNTMSLQETSIFLREGLTAKGKTLREHFEVLNHNKSVYYLQDASHERELSERLIKELHAILFEGVKSWGPRLKITPGTYKTQDNHVLTPSGKVHDYTPAEQVPSEMEKLMEWYDEQKNIDHPIIVAARFHHFFVGIHPFQVGNGRVSRLCMNFILMKAGYPPAIIKQEEQLDYYLALEQADNGAIFPLTKLIALGVERGLKTMAEILNR